MDPRAGPQFPQPGVRLVVDLDGTLFKDAAQKVFGVQMPNNSSVIGVVLDRQLTRNAAGELSLTLLTGGGSSLNLVFDVDVTRLMTTRVSAKSGRWSNTDEAGPSATKAASSRRSATAAVRTSLVPVMSSTRTSAQAR